MQESEGTMPGGPVFSCGIREHPEKHFSLRFASSGGKGNPNIKKDLHGIREGLFDYVGAAESAAGFL